MPTLAVSQAEEPGTAQQSSAAKPAGSPEPANVAGPAASYVDAERPTSLILPSGSVMRVRPVSTSPESELDIPTNTNQAGWWDGSSQLGEPYGSTVMAGHVDSFEHGLGKFAQLLDAQPGDIFTVETTALSQRFEVTRAELVPKSSLSADSDLYDVQGDRRLVLITCGGAYDAERGGYRDNMIVIAEPLSELVER
ncbi:MAG: class F sortase [Nocardioidaceae bacterium]|nr:class F sortase [Nocardioidaceae bacterium]